MTWAKIDNLELDAPSAYSENFEVIGGFNITMTGAKRRYIKAVKKRWQFSYDLMSADKFSLLANKFNQLSPSGLQEMQTYVTFTILDSNFSVSGELCHLDMGERAVVPGTNVLSNVDITLTQL